jgi:PAS domain S-box-containing protein
MPSKVFLPSLPAARLKIVIIGLVLFLIFSGMTILLSYRHYQETKVQSIKEDQAVSNLISLVTEQNIQKLVKTMESYSNRPLLIQAVQERNVEKVKIHLANLIKNDPDTDILVMSDPAGTLWASYPERPEVMGKNLAYREWYQGISKEWKTYVSDAVLRIVAEKDVAFQIAVPVKDEAGNVLGIMVSTQRVIGFREMLQRLNFDPGTFANITDRIGNLVYSSRFAYDKQITPYPFYFAKEKAITAKNSTVPIKDAYLEGRTRYLTYAPVTGIGWSVFVGRDSRTILMSGLTYYIQTAAIALLLFVVSTGSLFYFRKRVLAQQLQEQLQAEITLRQSEESERETRDYLDKLIGYANAPIIVWDPRFIITRFNHAFEDLTGLKAEEVLGKEIDLLFPGDRREECLGHIRQTTGGERWEVIEIPILHRDGSVRTVLWNSATIFSPDGKRAVATIAQGQDITDRKRVEEAQVRLVAMLDATPGFVGYADARDTHILYINTAGRKMVGVQEQEDVTQLNIADVHPDWTNKLFRDEIIPTAIRDGLWTGECAFLNRDGHEIPVMMALLAHKLPSGEVERFSTVSIDITDRRRAEEQIHRQGRLLAAINSVFYETLTADSEAAVAKACLKVAQEITDSKFGFIGEITPEGLFTTTALSDPGWEACRIPETQANVLIKDMVIRGIWGQVILKEQSLIVNDPVSYPDRVGIPEGHPPLTSFLGVPLKDQGKVIGMISMGNRVSGYTADQQEDMEALSVAFVEAIRRKKAEEEIKKLNTELEQRVLDRTAQLSASNKELEAFSYSVSHDLRAPLRSIDGFSQALLEEYQDKPLDATGKTFLDRVRKATQRMGLLIDDMLKLSRITQAAMKKEAFDLSGMIRELTEAHQKINPDRVVDVTVQEGVTVQGDPYLLKIAMDNLLGNAFKFTGKEAHPRIGFGATVGDGETTCFIRDNGAGFDMAYVNKLFGAFQRLHTADEFPGTGIGLATVQRVIHRHGGRVWAEGKVGKGATFYFTIA